MQGEGAQLDPVGAPSVVAAGPFAGWLTWGHGEDPYETVNGPFYFRKDAGQVISAFQPRREHLNGGGAIHGGALMTFADFSFYAIAYDALAGGRAVTLTFSSEFIGAGDLSGVVEARGEVLRAARSVIFVRGLVTQVSRPLLAFSGTLKKINMRPRG
jgi:acyl-coenzyme A thioesterase PaaI-like protein